MENRLYAFDWKYIGDMELGRPNLGKTARLEIYRLFQYTLPGRYSETEYGTEQSDRLLYKAGFLAGTEFCKRYVGECASFSDFVAKVQAALEEMNVGILHVERADMDKLEFTLTVAEIWTVPDSRIWDMSSAPTHEGLISGLFKSFTGKSFESQGS